MPPLILALSLKGLPDNFMLCQSFCSTIPPSHFPRHALSATSTYTHSCCNVQIFSCSTKNVFPLYSFVVLLDSMSQLWCLSVYSRVYNTHTYTHVCVDRAFLPPLRRFAQNSILNLESSNRNRNRFGPRRQTPQTPNYIHST